MPKYEDYADLTPPAEPVADSAAGRLRPTPCDIEGPFYLAGAPLRDDASEGQAAFVLTGGVTDTDGNPLPGVTLDFWTADPEGVYDETGYRHRGKVRTNSAGRYAIILCWPGSYRIAPLVFRCPHVHVKLSGERIRPLTTQLYKDHQPHNRTDPFFDPRRLIVDGRFDFVLERSPAEPRGE